MVWLYCCSSIVLKESTKKKMFLFHSLIYIISKLTYTDRLILHPKIRSQHNDKHDPNETQIHNLLILSIKSLTSTGSLTFRQLQSNDLFQSTQVT